MALILNKESAFQRWYKKNKERISEKRKKLYSDCRQDRSTDQQNLFRRDEIGNAEWITRRGLIWSTSRITEDVTGESGNRICDADKQVLVDTQGRQINATCPNRRFRVEKNATEYWLALGNRDLGEVRAAGCREAKRAIRIGGHVKR